MACEDKIFINTDISIKVNYTSVPISEIAELYVKFVNRRDNTINKVYLLSGGGVIVSNNEIIINITKNDITEPGIYDIYAKRTDLAGKVLGVVACPNWVRFYNML